MTENEGTNYFAICYHLIDREGEGRTTHYVCLSHHHVIWNTSFSLIIGPGSHSEGMCVYGRVCVRVYRPDSINVILLPDGIKMNHNNSTRKLWYYITTLSKV